MLNGNVVVGYYILSAVSVALAELPRDVARKLPRYPAIPAVRMSRLAIDHRYRGRGLGGALLVNALRRAARSEIPAVALIVDANDEGAAAFYEHFGFQSLTHDPLASLFAVGVGEVGIAAASVARCEPGGGRVLVARRQCR